MMLLLQLMNRGDGKSPQNKTNITIESTEPPDERVPLVMKDFGDPADSIREFSIVFLNIEDRDND